MKGEINQPAINPSSSLHTHLIHTSSSSSSPSSTTYTPSFLLPYSTHCILTLCRSNLTTLVCIFFYCLFLLFYYFILFSPPLYLFSSSIPSFLAAATIPHFTSPFLHLFPIFTHLNSAVHYPTAEESFSASVLSVSRCLRVYSRG